MQDYEKFKKLIDNNVEQMMIQLEIYTEAENFIDEHYSTKEHSKKMQTNERPVRDNYME